MGDICAGVNVLEMGAGSIAASMAGMVLADAGARVIKIEPPAGDSLRALRPSGFRVWNRGKESQVADLRTPAGQQAVRDCASRADIVLSAFAPGRAEQWNVGADALCAANPGLIHTAISAFGPTGPYAQIKGYDTLVEAKAGLFGRGSFAHRDGAILYPVPWASFGAAMQSVAGSLAALLVRDETGLGQQVHATLMAGLEPVDYFMQTVVQLMAKRGEGTAVDARSALGASRYGVLVCTRDGRFIQTSTMLPHQARALGEVAGIADQLADERFARLPQFDTAEIAQEFEDLLWEAFRTRDLDHWLPLLEASPDVAFEVAVTSEQGLEHPQIVHNGDVITVQDADVGPIREVGPLGHFAASPMRIEKSSPALGENAGPLAPRGPLTGNKPVPAHPLDGVTIVEFGYFYAMPYGVAMAAALGARVIKIEDGAGDPHRRSFGHEVASMKTTAGKESVSLDLRTAAGRAAAQAIVAKADVFLTGFRAGIADRLGLGYDDLKVLNPALVYLHSSGYGTDGPMAGRACYAQAAQAVAGSFGRQVGFWADPARNIGMSVLELQHVVLPRLNQVVDGDSNAALAVLAALVLGVFHQRRTGEGQFISTSMIAGNALCYSDDFCSYEGKPPVQVCDEDYLGTGALDRVYETQQGWVCLAAYAESDWPLLAASVGAPELVDDSRFATAAARAENDEALAGLLARRFATTTAAQCEKSLGAAGVGCVEANLQGMPVFIATDPVLRDTGLTTTVEHPLFGEMVRFAPPVSFSLTPGRIALPSARGADNHHVLAFAGYDEAGVAALEAAGALIPPD